MYQKFSFIGNLGSDPEMRYTQDGKAVTSFPVAVNGLKDQKPLWVRVSVWDKQAEVCNKYLAKGRKVYVEGRIAYDPETGAPRLWKRQDGSLATSLEVTASVVQFLDSKVDASAPTEEVF